MYYAENEDCQIISNRGAIVSLLLTKSTAVIVDPTFSAWQCGVGWPLTDETLFQGVKALPQGTTIQFAPEKVVIKPPEGDIWHNSELSELFLKDKKVFWDSVYEKIVASMSILKKVSSPTILHFFLSGGKDSRVLLALCKQAGLLDKMRFQTSGPPFGHDVIAADRLVQHYQLDHFFQDSVYLDYNYAEHIPEHMFLTESIVSPAGLHWNYKPLDKVYLIGHDGGLREGRYNPEYPVKGKDRARQWAMDYFYKFDCMEVLPAETVEKLKMRFENWLNNAVETTYNVANLPARYHLETRFFQFVAGTKASDCIKAFSPYFLATDIPILAAYNMGPHARASELFHYEIMMRSDPWLVESCPFGAQRWSPLLKEYIGDKYYSFPKMIPSYQTKKTTARGGYSIYMANHDVIFDYLLGDRSDKIFQTISYDKLAGMRNSIMPLRKTECLWQIVQLKMVHSLNSFKEAAPRYTATSSPIPEMRIMDIKVLSDEEYANRDYCNGLLAKSALVDYYREAIIDILGNLPDQDLKKIVTHKVAKYFNDLPKKDIRKIAFQKVAKYFR